MHNTVEQYLENNTKVKKLQFKLAYILREVEYIFIEKMVVGKKG